MTQEQQIKALAELDELTRHDESYLYKGATCSRFVWKRNGQVVYTGDCFLPNYLTSYDAIIPLIQKQSLEIRDRIATKGGPISFMVTPAQLAEKLLRATNRWTE